MIKKLLSVLFIALILSGCSSDDKSENVNTNPCQNIGAFTVTQNFGNLNISFQDNTNPLYYDLSLVYPGSGNGPDNGSFVTLNSTSSTIPLTSFGLVLSPGQTYLLYIRKACSNESKSSWSAAKSITIANYCETPTNLQVQSGPTFTWENRSESASYYQVQYGLQGFTLGSGTTNNVNDRYYSGMSLEANKTYDFYVRTYCTNGSEWGEWAGPYTYYSEYNFNRCLQPTNVTYNAVSGSAVNFRWNYNGESNFEYALLSGTQTIANATIHTIGTGGTPTFTGLSSWVTYEFYVRAVCANGNHTPWTRILVDF